MEKVTIFKKLLAVQSELKAKKSRFNKFGGFSYRSAEDILEAVKPLLKKNGLVLICSDTLENNTLISTYRLIDVDNGTELQNSALAVIGEHKGMSAEQNIGCASSYARKYALNGLFAIDDSDADPDSFENRQDEPKPLNNNDELLKAKKELMRVFNKNGIKNAIDIKELVAFMGIDTQSVEGIKDFLSLENLNNTIKHAFDKIHENVIS